jgi:transposase InsO family protein
VPALARELGIHPRTAGALESPLRCRRPVDPTTPSPGSAAARAIAHRLTQPFRPQTNGMVERFNRRLGEHLARMPQNRAAHHGRFLSHAERDACLHTLVAGYNRSRLRCLDYQAPAELLAKLAGHNTCAGKTVNCERMILLLGIGRSACGERPCCDNQKIDEPETTE